MIPMKVLDAVIASKTDAERVIRLAYEIAFAGNLAGPKEGTVKFLDTRTDALQEIFERHK